MAQETVIHRLDAELALGAPIAPIPEDLAVDGIDEVLKLFVGYGSHAWLEDFQPLLAGSQGPHGDRRGQRRARLAGPDRDDRGRGQRRGPGGRASTPVDATCQRECGGGVALAVGEGDDRAGPRCRWRVMTRPCPSCASCWWPRRRASEPAPDRELSANRGGWRLSDGWPAVVAGLSEGVAADAGVG